MNIVLLILYTFLTIGVGLAVIKKWFEGLPSLLSFIGALLLGTTICVPATYLLAVLFSKSSAPLLWGVIVTTGVAGVICYRLSVMDKFKSLTSGKMTLSPIALIIFSLLLGAWMMTKTFHGGSDGQLFVGSNNVFDFGHSLGIIRSFSWGSNIPFMSPFQAGLPFFYHFFFYFWVAIWEYFGVPTVWAMNIPSALSFASMLVVIYYLPQIIAKQKPIVGWIAVFLTITNSSLTFWKIIGKLDIWHLATYPFAGPFDGSIITIFITLNNYVNQRHLAFATGLGLLVILWAFSNLQKKQFTLQRSLLFGVLTGLLFFWNVTTYVIVTAIVGLALMSEKRWKVLFSYIGVSAGVGLLMLLPMAGGLYKTLFFVGRIKNAWIGQSVTKWNMIQYLWLNLGILPPVALFGYTKLASQAKRLFIPFVVLFVGLCMFAAVGNRGFEQKSLSFLIIGIDLLAAVGVGWLWQKKRYTAKWLALIVFLVLSVSGVVDLMPIKNEFAFPLVGRDSISLVSWIRSSTPKNAVFVSYADIIDPVVLSGRKNYFGIFGNVDQYDRSPDVKAIYAGDVDLAKTKGISYILAPKWQKNDFPYTLNLKNLPVAYEDSRFIVFAVR